MASAAPPSLPTPADLLAALQSLDDVIIGVDPELRVTTWNDAAARLLDRSMSDVAGKPLMQLIAPRHRIEAGQVLTRGLGGERVTRHDVAFTRGDATEIVISVAVGPIAGGAGKPSGLVILGHDITAQHRLHAQLMQSRRMESTGQLAGGIAHEFNNILTAILALADFTVRSLPADSPARDDVEGIREEATKGARLVRHLLAFSRRQHLRTEVVRVGAIIQELEPLLQRLVSERILIATDVSRDTLPVEIDRAQIELVLLELVANATDAMDEGGTLTVETKPVAITTTPGVNPGDYVQITVQDTGIGFDPREQERLLEPFVTTKGENHVGLGLQMVEGIVKQHGGAMTIESAVGRGTTVQILIPAARTGQLPEAEAVTRAADPRGGTETVLVVEDESAVRSIICRSLRARGYNILEARNGEDALIVAERHNAPIHLVVTDVVMPEMGGADLFRHLRRWYPTMRMLFISGYAKGAIPPEALEEGGGAAFLGKPFTLDQLAVEVRRVIDMPRRN